MERYQDYVIKDGEFVGRFEEMYQNFEDPWEQSVRVEHDSTKALILSSCLRLRSEGVVNRVVELGCGFGSLSSQLSELGFDAVGVDVSPTCIEKAMELHPTVDFHVGDLTDFELLRRLSPDAIVMAEVTWYVLPHLRDFLSFLQSEMKGKHLLHSLTVYEEGVQKYGRQYFTNLEEIVSFFDLDVRETATVWAKETGPRTYFCAEIV